MSSKYQSLSTLPNRYIFIEEVSKVMAVHNNISLMLIDVMRFSDVSAAYNYQAGDNILLQIANRIHLIFQDQVSLGRISGDIFGLIITGKQNEMSLRLFYDRLVEHFKTPLYVNKTAFIADFKVGVTSNNNDGITVASLMSQVETALRNAKNNKHDNFCYVKANNTEASGRGLALKADLTRALKQCELELYFQPKVNLVNLTIIGAECLLRWHHPIDGVLFPGSLIEAAESYNMMNELGYWTIKEAFLRMSQMNQLGLNLPLSVNLSPSQLYDSKLVGIIKGLAIEYQVQLSMFELELTEDVALSSSIMVKRQLDEIRNLGITISIDDFGKGYSNLAYIRDLSLNAIKIDKTFIMELQENKVNKAIVQATKIIGDAKKCRVIAEGIETCQQLAVLNELNIIEGQGYLFSPAIAFDDYLTLCRKKTFNRESLEKQG